MGFGRNVCFNTICWTTLDDLHVRNRAFRGNIFVPVRFVIEILDELHLSIDGFLETCAMLPLMDESR